MTPFDSSVSVLKKSSPVHIVDFDIPFLQMMWLLVKWGVAAIPALIVLTLIGLVLTGVLSGVLR